MRIMIATDGSRSAELIFAQLGHTFRLPDTVADARVVTVSDTSLSAGELKLLDTVGELASHSEAAALEILEAAREALGDLADKASFHHVLGVPALEIVRLAREWPCDLLIVGRGKDHAHDRALMGSVSQHVMTQAPCTVVVCK